MKIKQLKHILCAFQKLLSISPCQYDKMYLCDVHMKVWRRNENSKAITSPMTVERGQRVAVFPSRSVSGRIYLEVTKKGSGLVQVVLYVLDVESYFRIFFTNAPEMFF